MKLFKKTTLLILSLSITLIGFTSASEMEITSKKQFISKDNKHHTYSGDVIISFANGNLSTKSSHVSLQKNTTVMEGDVEIILQNAIAKTQRVTFTPSQQGFIAQMDQVTLTYK
ncbi:hypothetical protein [Cognaticolwellia mytili]|uniref:hypothetical protein n=1 Tax=Cognaticolwellia mytili TaxID=1888913 RepID=UPI000A1785C7|nr:hypothetical protein [Cognaticolwellia mytili]